MTSHCLTRRNALGGAVAAGSLAMGLRSARAATEGLVVIGKDGWLFPFSGEVQGFERQRFLTATKIINDAVGVIKAAGIEVAIALNPSKLRIYREFLPNEFKYNPDADRRYEASLEVLTKPGTVVPDIATAFVAARKANPSAAYYFKADTHWTPDGAALAADVMCSAIKSRIKLPPSSRPGTQFGEPLRLIQGNGDLAAQLPANLRASYAPERYTIRKVVSDAAGDLLSDDVSDVVLIGNSYTQPKYGFAQDISNLLARPVGLTWRVHTFGSYAILLEYLNSASFKQHRPKLIIWDFHEVDMEVTPDNKGFWGDHAMPNDAFLASVRKAVG